MTEEDFNTILTNLDKYSKLKSLIAPTIDQYRQTLVPKDNCSPGMNCVSLDDTTVEESTNTTEIPTDEPISVGE
jgi:hypothetical protein